MARALTQRGTGNREGGARKGDAVQRCKSAYGLCKRAKVCGGGTGLGDCLGASFYASCIEVGLALRANLAVS